jgi:hypothetical protein
MRRLERTERDMDRKRIEVLLAAGGVACVIGAACGNTTTEAADGGTTTSGTVPAVFAHYASTVQVTVEGNEVVLRANGVPDHKSPYFASTDPRHAAYDGANAQFMLAPGTIVAESYVFRIPITPKAASTHSATPLGPIGISVNGVPLFNQYNGQNRPLTVEINTFDQFNGHPTPNGDYHYHAEPYSITKASGSSALVGFLLDGFPVYGPVENGRRVTNAELDAYHGHTAATADYPTGIYHYHVTDADPYINGAGFYGTPGTVGR